MGPVVNNLLFTIPSQASNFALACVEHILDDQMSNPKAITKNLKRIGSVASELGLALSGEINASGDAGSLLMGRKWHQMQSQNLTLLQLPLKVRNLIWSMLSNNDIMNLRLVSKELNFEIDHSYGLPVVIDTSSESIKFIQQVISRSCFVKELNTLIYFNFLLNPEKLENLCFHKKIHLTGYDLELILGKFPSLKDMTFYSKDDLYEVTNGGDIELVHPTDTENLFDTIRKKPVVGLWVDYNEDDCSIKWSLEMKPLLESNPQLKGHTNDVAAQQNQLGFIHLKAPQEENRLQEMYLDFLAHEENLYDLYCDLESVEWKQYTRAISQNFKTLTALHLHSIKGIDTEPFDCHVLKSCINLRFLTLSGKNSFPGDPSSSTLLPIIGVQWLTLLEKLCAVSFKNVYLTETEFQSLVKESKKTILIRIATSTLGNEIVQEYKTGWNWTGARCDKLWDSNESCKSEDILDDNLDMEIGDFEYEMSNFGVCNWCPFGSNNGRSKYNKLVQFTRNVTKDLPPAGIVKAIFVTAWIALC